MVSFCDSPYCAKVNATFMPQQIDHSLRGIQAAE